jgi:uncharacterized protein
MKEFKSFPEYSALEIGHRPAVEEAYRNLPPSVSDIVFSSLFAWQEVYGYNFSVLGNFFLAWYTEGKNLVFLPPLLLSGKITDADFKKSFGALAQALAARAAAQGLKPQFKFIPELYVRHIDKSPFELVPEPGTFDYVYKRKNLAALAGQKFSPKRNLISQFKRKYEFSYEPLGEGNIKPVYKLLPADKSSAEFKVVDSLIRNFSPLGLRGGIITVRNEPVAATIAAVIRDFTYDRACYDTAVVHFEKASTDFKGSYQMINQYFAESLPEDVAGVNREEDLGIEGLRKAKMSYNPDKLIKKYRLEFK